jgi:anti-sigma regulatory factor (Ser/Thr protein kinase)
MTDVMSIRIEAPADLMLLRPLDAFVRRLIEQSPRCAAVENCIDNLELVFNEAFMNIHDHSYRSRPNGPVWIQILMSPDRLEFRFEDEGTSFDPERADVPDPEVTSERGRGVWLIRHFMDEFIYRPNLDGRNVLRLVKYLP